jgi:undecaprenyl pyrophosphate phosphatase UppP
MSLLLYIVFVLIVVGMALWLVNNYVPMASSIRAILNVVVVLAVCIWLLQVFGLWTGLGNYPLPRAL